MYYFCICITDTKSSMVCPYGTYGNTHFFGSPARLRLIGNL